MQCRLGRERGREREEGEKSRIFSRLVYLPMEAGVLNSSLLESVQLDDCDQSL